MLNYLLMIHHYFQLFTTNTFAKGLNDELKKVHEWAFQWKMSFNPDSSKQAQEVIFSSKSKRQTHPPLVFNNNNVSQSFSQKCLGVMLDSLGLLCKLPNLLKRTTLITLSLSLCLSLCLSLSHFTMNSRLFYFTWTVNITQFVLMLSSLWTANNAVLVYYV